LHQTKLVAAQTPFWCAEHNSLLFLFFPSFEQELVVLSPSFDQYTYFVLTCMTTQHNFQLRGAQGSTKMDGAAQKQETQEGNM
jgi:hypothetical protein